MVRKSILFLIFSVIMLMISCAALILCAYHQRNDIFRCSGDLTAYSDNFSPPFLHGKVYITFEADEKGYMRVDGDSYSVSTSVKRPLHRFIFFDYQRLSTGAGDNYVLDNYRMVKSPADASGDEEFHQFMAVFSQGSQKLRLIVRRVNSKTSLISSVNSPLLICISQ